MHSISGRISAVPPDLYSSHTAGNITQSYNGATVADYSLEFHPHRSQATFNTAFTDSHHPSALCKSTRIYSSWSQRLHITRYSNMISDFCQQVFEICTLYNTTISFLQSSENHLLFILSSIVIHDDVSIFCILPQRLR